MNSAIQPVLIGSEIYRHYSFGANHPLVIPRVSTVIDIINALDWFVASDYRTAPRAKPKLLQQFHSQGYVDALQSIGLSQKVNALERQKYNLGTLSNPVFKEMFKRPATSVGSSILVAGGGSAYALGSGLYQGMAKHANGFCFLNDLAFAIRRLRSLRIERIAYVDLDAHHCDRFEAAFGNDDDFLIVSTHEEIRWSFTDTLRDNAPDRLVNILLPKSCNDGEFSSVIHQIVLPATRRFSPEALIIQGGGDAPRDDPLSRLSNGALWRAFSNLHDLLAHLKTIHSL